MPGLTHLISPARLFHTGAFDFRANLTRILILAAATRKNV